MKLKHHLLSFFVYVIFTYGVLYLIDYASKEPITNKMLIKYALISFGGGLPFQAIMYFTQRKKKTETLINFSSGTPF